MRFLLFFIIFLSCKTSKEQNMHIKNDKVNKDNSIDKSYTLKDTILENKILDTLIKIGIIERNNNYIDSVTNHKHGIAFIIDTLIKGDTDIFVQAGFNAADRFETHYQIYINPKTMDIKFYDAVDDKKLSIKEYEKWEASFK